MADKHTERIVVGMTDFGHDVLVHLITVWNSALVIDGAVTQRSVLIFSRHFYRYLI